MNKHWIFGLLFLRLMLAGSALAQDFVQAALYHEHSAALARQALEAFHAQMGWQAVQMKPGGRSMSVEGSLKEFGAERVSAAILWEHLRDLTRDQLAHPNYQFHAHPAWLFSGVRADSSGGVFRS